MVKEDKKALLKRNKLLKQLKDIHKYVSEYKVETGDIDELLVRKARLPALLEEYSEIYIEEESEQDSQVSQETFDRMFYTTQAALRKFCEDSQSVISSDPKSQTNLKMPQLHLKVFSGQYQEWCSFRDMFQSCVIKNTSLSRVEMFYYLKSVLVGEALKIIDSMPVTSDNFETAWNALTERYENKHYIINSHLKVVIDQPDIGGSVQAIRNFCTQTKQNLQALENLKLPVQKWDVLLLYILAKKLDKYNRREWELFRTNQSTEITCDNFFDFLEKRCQALEMLDAPADKRIDNVKSKSKTANSLNTTSVNKSIITYSNCQLCSDGKHGLFQCREFLKMNISDRIKFVKANNHCYNCLKPGCNVSQCNSRSCVECGKKHNSLLHINNTKQAEHVNKTKDESADSVDNHKSCYNQSTVLLSTSIVNVLDSNGELHQARCLLDSGSTSSFVTSNLTNMLGLKTAPSSIVVFGIGQNQSNVKSKTRVCISSCVTQYARAVECLVMDVITRNVPTQLVSTARLQVPPHVQLADPGFYQPGPIDILLGADVFYELLLPGQLHGSGQVTLQNSVLGWIATGRVDYECSDIHVQHIESLHTKCTDEDLHQQVAQFWELEELPTKPIFTSEQAQCEQLFTDTTTRDPAGRYIVKLPLREDSSALGDSLPGAIKRFSALERQLSKHPELAKQYTEFMTEYIELGHMSEAAPPTSDISNYYLPHHAVLKPDHLTTKCRVVFDASFKTTTKKSLNDILMVGPVVQQDLVSIILRFRIYEYIMNADITKMYRQIRVHEDHHDLQRIIWRYFPNEELKHYTLGTVTYGTSAAPYLATKTLQQLASDDGHKYPLAAKVLQNDFYVDDLLTGTNDINEAKATQRELISLLQGGGMQLRKWRSNCEELLAVFKADSDESSFKFIAQDDHSKILGLLWHPQLDIFQYELNLEELSIVTKRTILSTTAKIFDPLGLISPVVMKAKIIMQRLWLDNIGWDDAVGESVKAQWLYFTNNLNIVNSINIDRKVCTMIGCINVQVHAFSDSSEAAYGAAVYIRCEDLHGRVTVNLLIAKSRVAPLKKVSLPRLELCGVLLLARLLHKVLGAIDLRVHEVFCWADSTIALAWITNHPSKWKTFVANRVTEIQQLTESCQWRHVPSADNPADLISRGVDPGELLVSSLWWHGPSWLQQHASTWPVHSAPSQDSIIEEMKLNNASCHLGEVVDLDLPNKYSSWNMVIRVTAYIFRFISNCRTNKQTKQLSSLTNAELNHASQFWCKQVQRLEFAREIQGLQSNKPLHAKSKILSLYPFLDEAGVLRVGGRLRNAKISFDQRHPILLPKGHRVAELIAQTIHKTYLHVGPQGLLSIMRQQYWPIHGKLLTKMVVRRCITCFRANPTSTAPLMGQLPSARVIPSRPFLRSGVDFCGPVPLRQSLNRKSAIVKGYVAIFVCMTTKAVHIELCSDLTTEAFMAALRRFMARRGNVKHIYSDNATNFLGADRAMVDYHKRLTASDSLDRISSLGKPNAIEWHFIPPTAPHFGGLWERAVRSCKQHLKRVVGESVLTFEEMYTLLTQVEACLNSRPITALSDNPNDFGALTPGHFLTGDYLLLPSEPDLVTNPQTGLKRWKLVQAMMQDLWKRWSCEYLSQLQQLPKWTKVSPSLQVNDLVLIKDDNLSPLNWCMGRITKLLPGKDNIVRVAVVKTQSLKEFKRPVIKLCKLPINTD